MAFLQDQLDRRRLPPLLTMEDGSPVTPALWPRRRRELLELLERNLYGRTPPPPDPKSISLEELPVPEVNWAGKLVHRAYSLAFDTPGGRFSFPFHLLLPTHAERPPVFLHIAFRPDLPDRYAPVEELIDSGFGLASFCYQDVVPDAHDGDFARGLAGKFHAPGPRSLEEWGKIGVWAWAASRVMDVLASMNGPGEASGPVPRDRQPLSLRALAVDRGHVVVCGHSRLGKTALWCAAQDERFWAGYSNDSGVNGAALAKCGQGEKVRSFLDAGSWDWFCERYKTFDGREDALPYDQHMLLAAAAPRRLYIASARDSGDDPQSEFLSGLAASPVWRLLGREGLVTPDRYPVPAGDLPSDAVRLHEGEIGYHIRPGMHFFSRTDWQYAMDWVSAAMARESAARL